MLPFAVLGFVIKPLHLKGASSKLQNTHTMLLIDLNLFLMSLLVWLPSGFAPDDKGKNRTDNLNVLPTGYGFSAVLKDLKLLLVDKVYVTNILGNHYFLLECVQEHLCRFYDCYFPVTFFFLFIQGILLTTLS